VRDALRELVGEHLVTGGDGRNWRVASFSPERLNEIYIVREALESDSVRLCAQKAAAEEIERLRRLADRLDGPDRDVSRREDADLEKGFHVAIAETAGFEALAKEIEGWITVLLMAIRETGFCAEVGTHRQVVDAIATGDPDRAERTMRDHIRGSRQNLMERMTRRMAR